MQRRSFAQILIGGTIVFLGVGFLLGVLNIWDFGHFIGTWWPAFLGFIGILSLVSNPSLPLWPLFIIGVALLLLLHNLGVIHVNIWQIVWPLAIILFGLTFFVGPMTARATTTTDDTSNLFVAFSGINSISKSAHYLGGKLSALFGGINLDLRQAQITDRAKLEIFTAFGGVDLKVPEGWKVNVRGLPVFGGWDDKTKKPAESEEAPVLDISGTCLFGGVSIKNA